MRNLTIKLRLPALAALAALALCLIAGPAEAQERRMATLAPDGSTWMKILSKGASKIGEVTDKRVTVKFYANGVQGDERDVVRKMRLKQLDGASLTSVGLSMIDESIRVLELPMMFKDVKELDYVRKKMWPRFKRKFKKKGFVLNEPGDVGYIYVYSNTPIKAISDLKKTKMWLWTDDRIVRALFSSLGINGVPLGVPDVLPALNTGRVDAVYTSAVANVALQWYSRVKYTTSMPISYGIGATVVRSEVAAKASAADAKAIKKVLRKQGKALRKAVRKDNKRAFKAITRKGVKVIETPPAMVAEVEKHAKAVWKELVGKVYSQEELDLVLKYRDEYRAKKGG